MDAGTSTNVAVKDSDQTSTLPTKRIQAAAGDGPINQSTSASDPRPNTAGDTSTKPQLADHTISDVNLSTDNTPRLRSDVSSAVLISAFELIDVR